MDGDHFKVTSFIFIVWGLDDEIRSLVKFLNELLSGASHDISSLTITGNNDRFLFDVALEKCYNIFTYRETNSVVTNSDAVVVALCF